MRPVDPPGATPPKGRPGGPAGGRGEVGRATSVAALLLASSLGFLALSAWLGLLGPSARWALAIVVLLTGAWLALLHVGRRSSPVRALRWAHVPPENPADPVGGLLVLLRRARRGRPYSQLLVAQRVRDALLERVRVARGLGYERLNEARRDPALLAELLGDPGLAAFVQEVDAAALAPDGRARGASPLDPSGPDFLDRLAAIVGRVEAWD